MKSKTVIIIALILLTLPAVSIISNEKKPATVLKSTMGEHAYLNCGLEKLTIAEEEQLMTMFIAAPAYSYTETSAERYLQRKGWKRARVLGAVEVDRTFKENWLVVWDNYETYTLDPFGSFELPEPGIYWMKHSLSSWEILYPDGTVESFLAKDLD